MKDTTKALLKKYIICFSIASLISFGVIWMKGFFTDRIEVNVQILSDAFFVSGILFTMFAALLYISNEGGFIGIGFVLRNVVQAFIPMGRANHEVYAKYRERKLAEKKLSIDRCVLVTGLVFLGISIIISIIWYANFYNPTV